MYKDMEQVYKKFGAIGIFLAVLSGGIKALFCKSKKMSAGWQKPVAIDIVKASCGNNYRRVSFSAGGSVKFVKEVINNNDDIYPLM
jgi:hypothetical protein